MAQTARMGARRSTLEKQRTESSPARDAVTKFFDECAEKGSLMFCGNGNGCFWIIIILILLFCCGGWGCGNGCGCGNNCDNGCGCGC